MAPPGLSSTSDKGDSGGSKTVKKKTFKTVSRSYPRGVGLDFRKLAGLTLVSYIDHHGVNVRPEAPPSELAVAVARHFEQMDVEEEQCIGGFLERLEKGPTATTEYARNTQQYPLRDASAGSSKTGGGSKKKDKNSATPSSAASSSALHALSRKRTQWAARPGEQVAAKVTRTDENGSWILASVQRFYPDTETYDVQDEDDTSKLIRLPWSHVMRLSTGGEGCFTKGADCMAIFPETTSFYKAKVAKSPVWKLEHMNHHGHGSSGGGTSGGSGGSGPSLSSSTSLSNVVPVVKEIVVKFDDDEDTVTGKTPHRRVPSRYVIPVPSQYFYEEQEDVDLTPPQLMVSRNTSGPLGPSNGGSAGTGPVMAK